MSVFSNKFVYLNYSGSVNGDNIATCTALIKPKFKPDIKSLLQQMKSLIVKYGYFCSLAFMYYNMNQASCFTFLLSQ